MREKIVEVLAGINDEVLTLSDQDNLLELEVFDSLDIIEMIETLEKQFRITITPEEITLENISTIEHIVKLLKDKVEEQD